MHLSKPEWLKTSLGGVDDYGKISALVATYKINTICKSGRCPNHNYCWSKGSAAFMICGDICTRSCGFCNTKTGKPLPLENSEPEKLSSLIAELNLKAVVLTSVDRDDLPDSGV